MVIYTRQSKCAPIRAEEGITGVLCSPNSSTSFRDLPEEHQIGGYPTCTQLASCVIDATSIDSEGRCVILEFAAFVLLGVYCPANRDETRDDFRIGFLTLLDARIRNLESVGKRVILTGDLNISGSLLDSANPEASMRKSCLTADEWISTPSRRLFNHLLVDGQIVGERDKGRERSILWDICRGFHPFRTGMFTCWEQKVNARPGNHGSRIDYVLCSSAMKDWFYDSNIQEGLMVRKSIYLSGAPIKLKQGSDHCPVYAIVKEQVPLSQGQAHFLDLMNPAGMFVEGQRQRMYSTKDILPLSGRLIPEFDGRRSIRDMFARKPSTFAPTAIAPSSSSPTEVASSFNAVPMMSTGIKPDTKAILHANDEGQPTSAKSTTDTTSRKRAATDLPTSRSLKRSQSGSTAATPTKGQQSLKGFFKSEATTRDAGTRTDLENGYTVKSVTSIKSSPGTSLKPSTDVPGCINTRPQSNSNRAGSISGNTHAAATSSLTIPGTSTASPLYHSDAVPTSTPRQIRTQTESQVHDQVASAESWSKLFARPVAPRCESHNEPCISLLTKKSGMNCGRSFWMCPRPLGPSGAKEKNTQWRCQTFIWCSDWNSMSP